MIQTLANWVANSLGRDSWIIRTFRPTYENTLNALGFGDGIGWAINGVPFRIDAQFRSAMSKHYDADLANFFKERISPGAVCFDIGANVGVYALQFAEWSKPNGTVVAFEPNPPTAAALRRHIAMNQLTQRVKVIEEAVADQAGTAEFFAAGCDLTNRLGAPSPFISNRAHTISVPITTVDEYVAHSGLEPDVMLIDVEGFEIQVLRGAYQVLKRHPEMLLVVEMHPDAWESARTTRQQTAGLFQELGVSVVGLSGQKDPLEEYGSVWLRRSSVQ